MASFEQHLSRFELLLQDLVEGNLRRLLGRRRLATEIAAKLSQVLEAQASEGKVAGHYRIVLSSVDYQAVLPEEVTLRDRLATFVTALAAEMQMAAPATVTISLESEPDLRKGQVSVEAISNSGAAETTRVQQAVTAEQAKANIQALEAFLIAEGGRHIALAKPVMSIGRQVDNDIVVESASVSRRHAQIRWRFGRFVIIDLGSRGGTRVNGEVVEAAALQPGDVVGISDVTLIFGVGDGPLPGPNREPRDGSNSTRILHS